MAKFCFRTGVNASGCESKGLGRKASKFYLPAPSPIADLFNAR